MNKTFQSITLLVFLYLASTCHAVSQDRTIEFPEHKCRLVLTDPNLEWLDHSQIPQALAVFGDRDGNMVIFMVIQVPDNFALDSSFIKGFDESFTQSGMMSKIDGQITTFKDAPCYLIRAKMLQQDLYVTNRSFYANKVMYGLQLISNELPEDASHELYSYFSCFEFVGVPDITQSNLSASERRAYNIGKLCGQIIGYCIFGIIVILPFKFIFGRKRRKEI